LVWCCFTEGKINNAMASLMKGFEYAVSDGTRDHVHDEVGCAVVGHGSIAEVEGGWSFPFNDVVEVNLHPSLVQFPSDKRANQASAQAMNPHATPSFSWVSKVPAAQPRPFLRGEEIMNIRGDERP
jgi:hypothetical protein